MMIKRLGSRPKPRNRRGADIVAAGNRAQRFAVPVAPPDRLALLVRVSFGLRPNFTPLAFASLRPARGQKKPGDSAAQDGSPGTDLLAIERESGFSPVMRIFTRWTPERDEELKRHKTAGLTAREIAVLLNTTPMPSVGALGKLRLILTPHRSNVGIVVSGHRSATKS